MHNKDKVILDKKLPYEYNICLYILEELCDKGVIDVFEIEVWQFLVFFLELIAYKNPP